MTVGKCEDHGTDLKHDLTICDSQEPSTVDSEKNVLVYEDETFVIIDEINNSGDSHNTHGNMKTTDSPKMDFIHKLLDVQIVHEDNTFIVFSEDFQQNDSHSIACKSEAEYDKNFPPLSKNTLHPNPWKTQKRNEHKQAANKSRYSSSRGVFSEKCVIGSNVETHVKAISSKANQKDKQENKVEKGVFVSRLRPRTTVKDIESLLKDFVGRSLPVEKLRTKYDSYSSFYIACDRRMIKQLLNSNTWPSGALVKVYEE